MISLTEPLLNSISRDKEIVSSLTESTSLTKENRTSTDTSSDTASVASSILNDETIIKARQPCTVPYVAPSIIDRTTVIGVCIVIGCITYLHPAILLLVALISAILIPYIFRINDNATTRRQLYVQYCQENDDQLPERFRNRHQYVNIEESYWMNDRGMALCTTIMTPKNNENEPINAVVCFCHGYTDHNGFMKQIEYQRLCENANIAFCGIEYEGHGRSDGTLGLIENWDLLINDVSSYFQYICQKRFPDVPIFLMGESMGGAVSYYVYNQIPSLFRGVIFVCPMCKISDHMLPHPLIIKFLKWLVGPQGVSSCLGYLPIAPSKNNLSHLTHRIETKRLLSCSIPLTYDRNPRLATARELLEVTQYISMNLKYFTAPFVVLHGTDDRVTDPMLSKALYEESTSMDKTIHLYEGMCHSLTCGESDENIDRIFNDITQWILKRL